MLSAKIGYFRATAHPEALAWQTRVIANGGTVSASTLAAVSNFCNAIQSAGIRDRFFRLNLFAGTGLAAALVPIYRGQSLGGTQFGNATDTNTNFVAGDYVETGATGGLNGNSLTSGKRLNTGLTPDAIGASAGHISIYQPLDGNAGVGAARIMGAGVNSPLGLWSLEKVASSAVVNGAYASAGNVAGANLTRGLTLLTRNSLSDLRLYSNGSQVASNSTTVSAVSCSFDISIFNRNFSGTYNTSQFWYSRVMGYSAGLPMTESQASAYYTALQAFQTALGRNV